MKQLWKRIYDYWDYIYFPGLRRRIAGDKKRSAWAVRLARFVLVRTEWRCGNRCVRH